MAELKDTTVVDFDDSLRKFEKTLVQTVQTLPQLKVLPATMQEVMDMATGRIKLVPSTPKARDMPLLIDTTVDTHLANHWVPPSAPSTAPNAYDMPLLSDEEDQLLAPDVLDELFKDVRDDMSLDEYDEFFANLSEHIPSEGISNDRPGQATTPALTAITSTPNTPTPISAPAAEAAVNSRDGREVEKPQLSRHQRRRLNNKYKRAGMQHQFPQHQNRAQRCEVYVAKRYRPGPHTEVQKQILLKCTRNPYPNTK